MNIKHLSIFALSFISLQSQAQSWPKALPEAKPAARWWWLGSAVDKENLRYNIDLYSKAGIGGLEITPIYGVKNNDANNIPYLSAKWMDMLKETQSIGKNDGVEIDMATGTGWPFGGPEVKLEQAATMAIFQQYSVDGGKNVSSAALGTGSAVALSGYGPLVAHAYAFTAQAFVKATSLPASGSFATILGRADGTNGYSWCLALDAAGQIVLKANLANDDGSCSDLTCETGVTLGGGWHQIAVTCDMLARTFVVYRDYAAVGTATAWTAPLVTAWSLLVSEG